MTGSSRPFLQETMSHRRVFLRIPVIRVFKSPTPVASGTGRRGGAESLESLRKSRDPRYDREVGRPETGPECGS